MLELICMFESITFFNSSKLIPFNNSSKSNSFRTQSYVVLDVLNTRVQVCVLLLQLLEHFLQCLLILLQLFDLNQSGGVTLSSIIPTFSLNSSTLV